MPLAAVGSCNSSVFFCLTVRAAGASRRVGIPIAAGDVAASAVSADQPADGTATRDESGRIADVDVTGVSADQSSGLGIPHDSARCVCGGHLAAVGPGEAADAVVSRHLNGGITGGHGSVIHVGADQPADIVVAGYRARGVTCADGAAVGPDQATDVVGSRHLDRNHLQVSDDGGGSGRAEQSDIVPATIDKQIGDGPTVALEDRIEAREAAGGVTDGRPSGAVVPVGVTGVGLTAAVGIEIQIGVQFISHTTDQAAAGQGIALRR